MVRTKEWMAESFSVKRQCQRMYPTYIFVLQDHNSREVVKSLSANGLM